jgi:hypothetical protein
MEAKVMTLVVAEKLHYTQTLEKEVYIDDINMVNAIYVGFAAPSIDNWYSGPGWGAGCVFLGRVWVNDVQVLYCGGTVESEIAAAKKDVKSYFNTGVNKVKFAHWQNSGLDPYCIVDIEYAAPKVEQTITTPTITTTPIATAEPMPAITVKEEVPEVPAVPVTVEPTFKIPEKIFGLPTWLVIIGVILIIFLIK